MGKSVFISFLFFVGLAGCLQAQFTQVELFSGFDKTDFSSYSSYPINERENLSLATLAFFQRFRVEGNQEFDEAGVQPTLFWSLNKHVEIGPSLYYNSIAGFSERFSVRFTFRNPRLLVVVIPSLGYYEKRKEGYGETFAQFQWSAPLSNHLSLWFNGQFLTVWDRLETHSRSFQQLRAGVSIKGHQLGVGADFDQYGPKPAQRTSFGLYYRKTL